MTIQELHQQFYLRPAKESLRLAEGLFHRYGDKILGSRRFIQLLDELNMETTRLSSQMVNMEMGEICTACASTKKGGCCSLYMADECDVLQILMNLLVKVPVTIKCKDGTECWFLGSTGCVFRFKPMFCLNYNCSRIKESAGREVMVELERTTGSQLSAQYRLEQELFAFFSRQSDCFE